MIMLAELLAVLRTPIAEPAQITIEKYHGDLVRRIYLLPKWEVEDALRLERQLLQLPHVRKAEITLGYIEIHCAGPGRWPHVAMQRIERLIRAEVRDYRCWRIRYLQRASLFDPSVARVEDRPFGRRPTVNQDMLAPVIDLVTRRRTA